MNLNNLTGREREILKWAAEGKSCLDTGQILGISEFTVHFHRKNIMRKLSSSTIINAVAKAVQLKLVTVQE